MVVIVGIVSGVILVEEGLERATFKVPVRQTRPWISYSCPFPIMIAI